jgi:hypothetical protein
MRGNASLVYVAVCNWHRKSPGVEITDSSNGAVKGNVLDWLRLEGLAVLALSLTLYHQLGSRWWIFAALFLAPDLSIFRYLANPRTGSACYNVVHSYLLPIALLIAGLATTRMAVISFACIWTAHIGFDRMLGYGLKYPTDFKATHLGELGVK